MIHKHIFVHAKPGMSEQEFFTTGRTSMPSVTASRSPRSSGYLSTVTSRSGPRANARFFQGAAEVWIENEDDELAFAQSKEYLQGSRLDEPNFLAWWQMFALDTTDQVIVQGPPRTEAWPGVKVVHRDEAEAGMPLDEFRTYSREVHAPKVAKLPGLRGYVQGPVNDGHYALGESMLDSVSLLWFDSTDAIAEAMQSAAFHEVEPDLANFVDPRYFRYLVTEESWVVPLESQS